MGDVDLLVRPRDYRRAIDILNLFNGLCYGRLQVITVIFIHVSPFMVRCRTSL